MDFTKDKELNKKLDSFFQAAEKVKKKEEQDWYEIDQFLQGNHYTVYLPKLDKLVEVRETNRGVRRQVNKMRKMMRAIINIILKNEPMWMPKPRNGTEEAQKEADIASKYLRYFYRKNHLREKLKDLVYLGFARGIAIGEVIEKKAKESESIQIDLECDLDVFDCYFDPSGKNRFFIKTFTKSKADLEETKDADDKPVYKDLEGLTTSKMAASDVKERLLAQQGHETASTESDVDLSNILCYEFWLKDEDGKVRIITRANEGTGKRIIRDEQTDKEDFPFEFYSPDAPPNVIYPKSWFKDLIPLQRALNRIASFVENYIFTMLWGKFSKKRGSKVSQIITKHGQILTYDGVKPPSVTPLQNMPDVVMGYMSWLEKQMEDLTVHAETMGGKTEKGQSGKAIALLQAADVQNLADPIVNLQLFLQKIGKLILDKLADQIVSEEFTIDDEVFKVIGSGADELEGAVKIGKFDELEVNIVPGSAFGDFQQKNEALALKKEGVVDNEAVLEAFKWGGIKEIMDRMDLEKRIEEAQQAQGPTAPPPLPDQPRVPPPPQQPQPKSPAPAPKPQPKSAPAPAATPPKKIVKRKSILKK